MFDPCPPPPVLPPRTVANDPTPFEDRRYELGHATIAAIGEYATVLPAERFHWWFL